MAPVGLAQLLRAGPGETLPRCATDARLSASPDPAELPLSDQRFKRGNREVDQRAILGKKRRRALPRVDDRPAPAVPDNRCAHRQRDDPRGTDRRRKAGRAERVGLCGRRVAEDPHALRLGERSGVEIDEQLVAGDEDVDIVAGDPRDLPKQHVETHPGMVANPSGERRDGVLARTGTIGAEVVFEKE